jgi:predicted house-cleaning NTP pyrophosphatase (Maf/HAM1 superfamily)
MGNSAGQSKKLISPEEQAHLASLEKARARGLPEDWSLGIYKDTKPANFEPNSMTGCLPSSQEMTQPNENDGIKLDVKKDDHTLISRKKRSRLMESTETDLEHNDTSAITTSPSLSTVPKKDENETSTVENVSSRIKKRKRELTHEEIHEFTAGLLTNQQMVRSDDERGRNEVCDTISGALVGSRKAGLMDERETEELTPERARVAMDEAEAKGLPDGWTVIHHPVHKRKNWLSPDGQKRYSSLSKALTATAPPPPARDYTTALAEAYERGLPRGWTTQWFPKRKRKMWISPDGKKRCETLDRALIYASNNREATTVQPQSNPSPAEVEGPLIAAKRDEDVPIANDSPLPPRFNVQQLSKLSPVQAQSDLFPAEVDGPLIASKRDEDVPIANDSPPPPRLNVKRLSKRLSESSPVQPQSDLPPAEVDGPLIASKRDDDAPTENESPPPSPAEDDGPYRAFLPEITAAAITKAKARGLPDGWTVKFKSGVRFNRKIWISPDQSVICASLPKALIASKRAEFEMEQLSKSSPVQPQSDASPAEVDGPLIASKRDEDVPIAKDSLPPPRFNVQRLSKSAPVQPQSNLPPAEVHGPLIASKRDEDMPIAKDSPPPPRFNVQQLSKSSPVQPQSNPSPAEVSIMPKEDENETSTVENVSSRIKKRKRELTHEEIHEFTAGLPTNHRTVRSDDERGRNKECDTIPGALVGSRKSGLMDERETEELTPEWARVAMEEAKAKGLPDGWTVVQHPVHKRKNWLSPDGQKRYSSLSKALTASATPAPPLPPASKVGYQKKDYTTVLAEAYERGLPRGWTTQWFPKRKRTVWISPDGKKRCETLDRALIYVSGNREATTVQPQSNPSPAEADDPDQEISPEEIAASMEEAKARGLPDGWTVKYDLSLKRKIWISPDQSVICDRLAKALIASKRDEDVPIALSESLREVSPEKFATAMAEAKARGLPDGWTVKFNSRVQRNYWISPDQSTICQSLSRALKASKRLEFKMQLSIAKDPSPPPRFDVHQLSKSAPVLPQSNLSPAFVHGPLIASKGDEDVPIANDSSPPPRFNVGQLSKSAPVLPQSNQSPAGVHGPLIASKRDEGVPIVNDSQPPPRFKMQQLSESSPVQPQSHPSPAEVHGPLIASKRDEDVPITNDSPPSPRFNMRQLLGSSPIQPQSDPSPYREFSPEQIAAAMEEAKARGLPDGWTVKFGIRLKRKVWISPDQSVVCDCLARALIASKRDEDVPIANDSPPPSRFKILQLSESSPFQPQSDPSPAEEDGPYRIPPEKIAAAMAEAKALGLSDGWTVKYDFSLKRKVWISPDQSVICDRLAKALIASKRDEFKMRQLLEAPPVQPQSDASPAEEDGLYREFAPEKIAAAMAEAKAQGLPDGWTIKYNLRMKRKVWISPDQSIICDCLAKALIASKRDEDEPIANDSPPPPRFKMQQLSESSPLHLQSNSSPAEVDGPYQEFPPEKTAAAMVEAKALGLPDGWTVKFNLRLKRKVWMSPDQSVTCQSLSRALIASKRDELKMQQLLESPPVRSQTNPSRAEEDGLFREFPPEKIAAAMAEAKARGLPDGWSIKYNLRLKRKVWISPDESIICDCLSRALIASKESKQNEQKVTRTIDPSDRRVLTEEEVACSMQEAASRGLLVDDGWHVIWNNHRGRKTWISPSGESYRSLALALEASAVEERRQGLAINHYQNKDTSQMISDQPVTTTRSGRPVKPPISKTLEADPYPAAGQSHHERCSSARRAVSTDRFGRLKSSNDREHLLSLALCEAKARGLPDGWSIYWDSGRKRRRWFYKSADGSVVRVCESLPMALAYSEKLGLANSNGSNTEHSPPTSSDSTLGESGLPLGWRTVDDNESRRQIFLSPDGRYCHTLPQALAVALQMTSSRYHPMAATEVSAVLEVAKSKGLVDWTVAWDKDADSIKWVSPGGRLCNSMERALSMSSARPCSLMDASTDNNMEQTKEVRLLFQ